MPVHVFMGVDILEDYGQTNWELAGYGCVFKPVPFLTFGHVLRLQNNLIATCTNALANLSGYYDESAQ